MKLREALALGISTMLVEKFQVRRLSQFTTAQAEALKAGLCQGANLLVCAPTSSGKTTIAEIAAVEGARRGRRTVYLVSHRALAEEKFRLFTQEYVQGGKKWFDVSIATGDHTEGTWESGILVATYEKYLALLCGSANFDMQEQVVVADEVQILGEENRGPEIELLCTLLRRGKPHQIVALSATISNPKAIADWLGCKIVEVITRDVPLQCEVWYEGGSIYCHAGDTEVFEGKRKRSLPSATLDAVDYLLNAKLGPILVFTMTRPQAQKLAEACAAKRKHVAQGLHYAEQFELFSEPSTLVRTLKQVSQRGVAFHTADLTFSERTLVETGLRDRLFDVVFATPTLAAGVNFPFQTVLFDGFHRKFILDRPWLPKSDFQNMAGRAGRLGLHEKGYAILLARSEVDYDKARELVSLPIEPLRSVFLSCSLRKIVLSMVASKVVRRVEELAELFENTLWWQQTLDRNPKRLDDVPHLLEEAIKYLCGNGLVVLANGRVFATRLGIATAGTGLLPQTVVFLLDLLKKNVASFDRNHDAWRPAIIHAVCASEEFGEHGQRQLPYAWRNQPETGAWHWIKARTLFLDPEHSDNADRVINASYALAHWVDGMPERTLANMVRPITYGYMQRLGNDAAWILDGLSQILRVPDAGFLPHVPNHLFETAGSLRYGLPLTMLDTLRAAEAYAVPGFGRHRAMALYEAKLSSPNDVLKTERAQLAKLLESEKRADLLIEALLKYFDAPLDALKVRHTERAKALHADADLVEQAYTLIGTDYERPIEGLLRSVHEWKITKLDTGKRQGFPDFMIEFDGKSVIAECKTKAKGTATISKDDGFAVLTKSTNIRKDHSVTIGKPDFDEFSKGKAGGSSEITLIRHQDFIEAILRYKAGKISATILFEWFMIPGFAQLGTLDALALRAGNE